VILRDFCRVLSCYRAFGGTKAQSNDDKSGVGGHQRLGLNLPVF
jgi:hypothetical protein